MAEYWAQLNGVPLTSGRVTVPRYGIWTANVELADDSATLPAGPAQLVIDDRTLVGTITRVSRTAGKVTAFVVGGAAGWPKVTEAAPYHSDAGITSKRVIGDLAREVGETLAANPVFRSSVVGTSYARERGQATRTLNALAEYWGVREDGLTYVGARPLNLIDPDVALLQHDTSRRMVSVYASRMSALDASCRRDDADDGFESLVFDGYRIEFDGHTVNTWLQVQSQEGGTGDRFTNAIRNLTNPVNDDARLWGLYEYEVQSMAGQRVNLRIVDPTEGVPDLVAVEEWLGPAIRATFPAGVRVGVMFRNGRRDKPSIVTARSSDLVTLIQLGGPDAKPVARVGDLVQVNFPPTLAFSGTISGAPVVGVISPMIAATGVVIGGSSKVGAA